MSIQDNDLLLVMQCSSSSLLVTARRWKALSWKPSLSSALSSC